MASRHQQRDVRFEARDGYLVRTVSFPDGREYQHRCPLAAYEQVAHAVEETPAEGEGTVLEAIARTERLPFTQANVALEFLKERGLVEVRHRRCYPASQSVHLDAMVEFHALREEPKPA